MDIELDNELISLSDSLHNSIRAAFEAGLYASSLYPQVCFQQRNVYGVPCKVLKEGPLYSYVTKFFKDLDVLLFAVTSIVVETASKVIFAVNLRRNDATKAASTMRRVGQFRDFLMKMGRLPRIGQQEQSWRIRVETNGFEECVSSGERQIFKSSERRAQGQGESIELRCEEFAVQLCLERS